MRQKSFTPDRARQELNLLRPAAESVSRLYRSLERRRPRQIIPEQRVDPVYFALIRRIHDLLGEIRGRGVEVRDLRQGSLAFPARRGGRQVLLCWRVGEPRLEFWHEVGEDCAGRRPVDDDGPWDES